MLSLTLPPEVVGELVPVPVPSPVVAEPVSEVPPVLAPEAETEPLPSSPHASVNAAATAPSQEDNRMREFSLIDRTSNQR
ncbi:MAG TPA: hypothetical protein VIK91_06255 [Nannocystis sp.]